MHTLCSIIGGVCLCQQLLLTLWGWVLHGQAPVTMFSWKNMSLRWACITISSQKQCVLVWGLDSLPGYQSNMLQYINGETFWRLWALEQEILCILYLQAFGCYSGSTWRKFSPLSTSPSRERRLSGETIQMTLYKHISLFISVK